MWQHEITDVILAPMDKQLEAIVTAVKQSKKYRDTHEETIRELAATALKRYKKPKQAIKSVRTQLHSIMAPYLGDPDYAAAAERLTAVFDTNDPDQIRAVCHDIMHAHLSNRERLPLLDTFYRDIFAVTGKPNACLTSPVPSTRWPSFGWICPTPLTILPTTSTSRASTFSTIIFSFKSCPSAPSYRMSLSIFLKKRGMSPSF